MASAAPGATGHRLSPSTVLQALHDSAKLAPPPTPGPAAPGGLAGDVQGSWGWSFLLGMGFLLLVYCIVGCCRASAHGRSGLAAIPHSDFWRSLPQLVGDGLRFAMGEEAVGPSERSVAGIAGHDDEYYSAGRRDSAEYVPIAGASVSSHASSLPSVRAQLRQPAAPCIYPFLCATRTSGARPVTTMAKGGPRTLPAVPIAARCETVVGTGATPLRRRTGRTRKIDGRFPHAPLAMSATKRRRTSGEIGRRATRGARSARSASGE
jgi:hypothetical protein